MNLWVTAREEILIMKSTTKLPVFQARESEDMMQYGSNGNGNGKKGLVQGSRRHLIPVVLSGRVVNLKKRRNLEAFRVCGTNY